ncbi:MAG TPA: TrkA family potassium uptake protein [Candidatus Dormibacteraeota bacterium]|nr:TrkA family potassium uptake protein [Candidatus Dormibacteraeota bacterium]
MKVVIVGCGRVGAIIAELLDAASHQVVIVDVQTRAFDRLTTSFGGNAVRGDGTDEDVLRRAGAEGADAFLALTEGDNRNIMAAQLASEVFAVPRIVAKINDPVRAEAYAALGIATLCRTNMMADAVYEFIGLPKLHLPGIQLPTGQHPGGEHHVQPATTVATALGAAGAPPAAGGPGDGTGGLEARAGTPAAVASPSVGPEEASTRGTPDPGGIRPRGSASERPLAGAPSSGLAAGARGLRRLFGQEG